MPDELERPPRPDEVARAIVSALHAESQLFCDPNNIEYRIADDRAKFTIEVDGIPFLVTVKSIAALAVSSGGATQAEQKDGAA